MLKSIKAGSDDLSWTRFATAPSLSLSLQDIVLVDMEVVLDKVVIRKEYERCLCVYGCVSFKFMLRT
jgi:hypothetical protein